jgi:hypothetical protein
MAQGTGGEVGRQPPADVVDDLRGSLDVGAGQDRAQLPALQPADLVGEAQPTLERLHQAAPDVRGQFGARAEGEHGEPVGRAVGPGPLPRQGLAHLLGREEVFQGGLREPSKQLPDGGAEVGQEHGL